MSKNYAEIVEDVILEAVEFLHRHYEMINLTGIDPELEAMEDGELDAPRMRYAYLADLLEDYANMIRRYEGHQHAWGENDYCTICGADGRA